MLFVFQNILLVLRVICLFESMESKSYVDTIVNSLEDHLKFCVENERILDINLLFGVTIVSGQLHFVEACNMEPKTYCKLNNIRNLCNVIFGMTFRQNIANLNFDETQQKLFSTKLWSFDVTPSHLQYHIDRSVISDQVKHVLKRHHFSNSSEFQTEYEFCVRLLIKKCDISMKCEQLILNRNSTDYVLTHQILYLSVLKQLILQNWCSFEDQKEVWLDRISFWLNDKCYHVYNNELTQISNDENQLLDNATLADLFIEQIVVCGLHSYIEFFHFKYIDMILEQNISVDKTSTMMENKYFDNNTEEMLSAAHMISVRIAAMILYVKHLSKNRPLAEPNVE